MVTITNYSKGLVLDNRHSQHLSCDAWTAHICNFHQPAYWTWVYCYAISKALKWIATVVLQLLLYSHSSSVFEITSLGEKIILKKELTIRHFFDIAVLGILMCFHDICPPTEVMFKMDDIPMHIPWQLYYIKGNNIIPSS